jgi:AraC family transcriptional regulator, glycine betaine-responsive activator
MLPSRQSVSLDRVPNRPKRFVFVLLPEFTMLCFCAAVESLRIANRMANRKLYDWKIIGEG